MYVCICNGITERQVRESVQDGARTLDALAHSLGVGTCCGRCRPCAEALLESCDAPGEPLPIAA